MTTVLPLTGWQAQTLAVEDALGSDTDFVRDMVLCAAIRVQPGFDARRLGRAFEKLCQRHDVLRSKYHRFRGRWVWQILERHPLGLEIHDHDGAPEADIQPIVRAVATTQLVAREPVLSRLDLLKFGKLGDVMVLRVHHGVSDGYGFMVAVEDLIGLLIGMPMLQPALSAAAYMAHWGQDRHPQPEAADRYWQAKLLPPPPPVAMGRVARGMPLMVGSRIWRYGKNLSFGISAPQEAALETRAAREGVTVFGLVNAALLRELSERFGAEDILYGMSLGRSDGALGRFAGHHSLHPQMRARRLHGRTLAEIARAAQAELAETVAHLPHAAGRMRSIWDARVLDTGGYPYQIMVGSNVPRARIKASPLLGAGGGIAVSRKVGKYTITPLPDPLPPFPGDLSEFTLRLNLEGQGGNLVFKYDADAYTDEQIEQIGVATCAALDIEPVGRQLDVGTPHGEVPGARGRGESRN